ncbi:MAG: hypothetical protein RIC94_04325 [Phycisphaerales bacterium]
MVGRRRGLGGHPPGADARDGEHEQHPPADAAQRERQPRAGDGRGEQQRGMLQPDRMRRDHAREARGERDQSPRSRGAAAGPGGDGVIRKGLHADIA